MKTKEESVRHMTNRLLRIILKHSQIETLPVRLGEDTELTPREIHCLQALGGAEGSNIKTLGEILGVTKSAASQMVGKLAEKGFARKEQAADNNKEVLAFLTEAGWDAFRVHEDFHERHMRTLLDRLGEFSEPQIVMVSSVLSVVESVVDERVKELFVSGAPVLPGVASGRR